METTARPNDPLSHGRVWDERAWPTAKAQLGRAFEIWRDLARAPWWN